MSNIVLFSPKDTTRYRGRFVFMNRTVPIVGDDGEKKNYPCLVLYEKDTDIPVLYTGLERYLCHLVKGEALDGKTLSQRAYAVCHFLNYLLKETSIDAIHECSIDTIRAFVKSIRKQDGRTSYQKDTWLRYRDFVIEFLVLYYESNKDTLPFLYKGEELRTIEIIRDGKHHRKAAVVYNSSFHVPAPKTTHKKNRILVDGYLDLLLYEAKKYDPDITVGIALGAYAGIREGEMVNVTCGRVKTIRGSYGSISGIEVDLTAKAPYFIGWKGKTGPGTIKKYRMQRVYSDFTRDFLDILDAHMLRMESRGYDTGSESPLFVNKQGRPMTVQTYSDRVKQLFYQRFLPSLKRTCEAQGTYADHAAFIETYESEYPGAHMFRHWFTMYLLTKARLTSGEIMRWRGDSCQESMDDYIHENASLIEMFRESSYTFQSWILDGTDPWKDGGTDA
jgi:integrase